MPYIGTSPSNSVRRVHTYTATASQTIFTGASSEGVTLSYADTNYIDVFQNGVLLGSADYTSTSGTSVVLAQACSESDLIVIIVYDVFSVADTVSKTNGGSFDSAVTMSNNLTVSGAFTSQGIDDNANATAITIDSNERVAVGHSTTGGANLAICDGANSSIQIFAEVATDTNLIQHYDQTSTAYMNAQYSGNTHQFLIGTTEVLRITNGNRITTYNCTGTNGSLNLVGEGGLGSRAVAFQHTTNGSEVGYISTTSTNTVFNTASDYRLKENVSYDFDATTRLKQLKPCRFNFKIDTDKIVDGFLAHEVSSIVPNAVTGKKDAVDENGDIDPQGIDHGFLVPLLTKTLQEALTRIDTLEAEVKALKGE